MAEFNIAREVRLELLRNALDAAENDGEVWFGYLFISGAEIDQYILR